MGALMVMEVSKKQHYIFKSKKLKDHIGASAIIRYVTEELFEKDETLLLSSYGGKMIFKGGGKSLFSFGSMEKAKAFVRDYSMRVLKDFPGVELFMSCIEHDNNHDFVLNALDQLFEKLAIKKSNRRHGFYQVDYGVNQVCKESKMPANLMSRSRGVAVSYEIDKKIEFALKIEEDQRGFDFFNKLLPEGCVYKDNMQDHIDSNKKMIAVVHIDGNNMGQRVLSIKKQFEKLDAKDNEQYLEALNRFSQSVDEAYTHAFKKMLEALKKHLQKDSNEIIELPIRPLILAGDDICFITEGDYGIECSKVFLDHLYEKTDSLGGKMMACAGIAIVKSKYPFFKAYELSEQLCSNAKKMLAINKLEASALDWHVSYGEISKSIWEIRDSEYVTDEDSEMKLFQRPYLIDDTISASVHLPSYKMFLESKTMIDRVSRNTIKSLRNALKTGPVATKDYFEIYREVKKYMMEEEFVGGASRSFDAIEVMDVFKRMEG